MIQNKIAANSTNSAAIDCEGELFVWGSSIHGLLGNGTSNGKPFKTPTRILISRSGLPIDSFSQNNCTSFKVQDVSMGHMHMAVVVRDAETNSSEIKQLNYAAALLQKLKVFVLAHFEKLVQTGNLNPEQKKRNTELDKIEISLEYLFQEDKKFWPFARVQKFQELMFKQAQITFTKDTQMVSDQLIEDLTVAQGYDNKINLKELRDQLVRERMNTGLVFIWGIKDERTGIRQYKDQETRNQETQFEFIQPRQIYFGQGIQIVKVECGYAHSLALSKNGEVFSWGFGSYGCLGLGPEITCTEQPRLINFEMDGEDAAELLVTDQQFVRIVQIASGSNHCMALSVQKKVYSWGSGQGGKLGHGDQIGISQPKIIETLRGLDIAKIECGDAHSGCTTQAGKLLMWGVGLNGRLGLATTSDQTLPQEMIESAGFQIDQVFFGMNSSFAICRGGICLAWGLGKFGKLALELSMGNQYLKPRKISRLSGHKIQEFAPGPFHTLVLTDNGFIYVFGNSKHFKLGLTPEQMSYQNSEIGDINFEIPQKIIHETPFFKQIGIPKFQDIFTQFQNYSDQWTLKEISDPNDILFVQILSSENNSYFLLNTGQIYACGSNSYFQCTDSEQVLENSNQQDYHQLFDALEKMIRANTVLKEDEKTPDGDQDDEEQDKEFIPQAARNYLINLPRFHHIKEPCLIPLSIQSNKISENIIVRHIAASKNHVLITSQDGRCFGWGSNEFGKLGVDSNEKNITQPVINNVLREQKVVMCAVGRNHSIFLTALGQIYSAGFNEFGQLGFESDILDSDQFLNYFNQLEGKSAGNVLDPETLYHNYFNIKTQRAAQLINGLSGVSFIACGCHHSMAITSLSDFNQEKLALYTWGWGAYGQLGQNTLKGDLNLSQPTKVQFSQSNLQILQVSAGEKHTLVLDSNQKIWYFGSKESVGIHSVDELCQFKPIKLYANKLDQNQTVKPDFNKSSFSKFTSQGSQITQNAEKNQLKNQQLQSQEYAYISAGHNDNLAIQLYDQFVYQFGKSTSKQFNKKVYRKDQTLNYHETVFKRVFFTQQPDEEGEDPIIKPLRSRIVSAGVDHFCAINEEDQLVYIWGENTDLKCGLEEKSDTPVTVPVIANIIKENKQMNKMVHVLLKQDNFPKSLKEEDDPVVQDIQPHNVNRYKFPIQEQLKTQEGGIVGLSGGQIISISNQDSVLLLKFNTEVEEFNQMLKQQQIKRQDHVIRVQDAIITRILNFPTKIDLLVNVSNQIPSFIAQNRQLYELIFTYLQLHPCYMFNLLTKTTISRTPARQLELVKVVYGAKCIFDNQRLLNILLVISEKILRFEVSTFELDHLVLNSDANPSFFACLFRLIMGNQSTNKYFLKCLVSDLLEIIIKTAENFNFKSQRLNLAQFDKMNYSILVQSLQAITKRFKLLTKVETTDASGRLSNQIVSLFCFARALLKKRFERRKDQRPNSEQQTQTHSKLENFLISLIFSDFFKQQVSISLADFLSECWDYGKRENVDPEDYFDFGSSDNLWFILIRGLRSYFGGFVDEKMSPEIKQLIRTGKELIQSQQQEDKSFVERITTSLTTGVRKTIDSSQILMEQLFVSSCEQEDRYLSVQIKDILLIQDTIISNQEKVCITKHANDPILTILNELNVASVPTITKDPAILKLRINLAIKHRELITSNKILRCGDCFAPVTENLIGETRFSEGVHGKKWKCEFSGCTQNKIQQSYICSSCSSTMPKATMPTDLVYDRFSQIQLTKEAKVFADVLVLLPVIEVHQDFQTVLEHQIKHLESEDAVSTSIQTLAQFKQILENIQNELILKENEKIMKLDLDDDPVMLKKMQKEAKLRIKLQENQILQKLGNEITKQKEGLNLHKQNIVVYERHLTSLRQKKFQYNLQCQAFFNILQQIIFNSYTGISSEFLHEKLRSVIGSDKIKDEQTTEDQQKNSKEKIGNGIAANQNIKMIWSGRLQQSDKILTQIGNQSTLQKFKQPNTKLADFMQEVKHSNTKDKNTQIPKQIISSSLIGSFEYNFLVSKGVILISKSGPGLDSKITNDSRLIFQYQFQEESNQCIVIELVYRQMISVRALTCSSESNEQLIDRLTISKDILLEMRRNFAMKSVLFLGNIYFSIFHLTLLLNDVVKQSDIFSHARKVILGDFDNNDEDQDKNQRKRGKQDVEVTEWDNAIVTSLAEVTKDEEVKDKDQRKDKKKKKKTKPKD